MAKSVKLTDVLRGYLLSRKSKKLSEKTMRWYRQKLTHFITFLEEEHEITLLKQVDINLLREYVEDLRESKAYESHPSKQSDDNELMADHTIKGYVQVVKGFFNWCLQEELIAKNPATRLENPTVGKYVIKTFTEDQIKAMLDFCNVRSSIGYRDYTIILLLLDTGIRVSELCGLTLSNVFIESLDGAFIKVFGKGRKEREVGLSSETAQHLWKYVHVHRQPKSVENNAVFINRFGNALTPSGVDQLLCELEKRTGITGVRVSAHTFRHTFARMFLENGGEVYKLSLLLGHSSVVVTERYLKDFMSRSARQDQSKHSPVVSLNLTKGKKGGFRRSSKDSAV
jgi:site-specific recombinase XerD